MHLTFAQVRLHEKALDDYVHDFDDWDDAVVVPEACVIDPIRAKALCSDGGAMICLLEEMKDGFQVEVEGGAAQLSLLRAKNIFANGGSSEPTRFRRIKFGARFFESWMIARGVF